MKLHDCLKPLGRSFSGRSAASRANGQKETRRRPRHCRLGLERLEGERVAAVTVPRSFRPIGQWLEERVLLTGTLNANQQSAIGSELSALGTFGTNLNQDGQFAQGLAAMNVSLGSELQMGSIFTTDFVTPAQSYFNQAQSASSASGLAAALTSAAPGNSVTVTGSVDGSGTAIFDVSMDVTKQDASVALTPGPTPAALGVSVTMSTVPLTVELKSSFSMSVDPTGNAGLSFSGPIQVIGTLPSGTTVQGSAEVGVLPATIVNGTANMDAEVDAAVQGANLHSSDLQASVSTLASLS
ncbi:MAG: hypothetical protein ACREHD_12970, partial [Pirellulales bacterium]